jgi:hypothetical protein
MLVVRRKDVGSERGWCRFGGLWGRTGRVSGGGKVGFSLVLLMLGWEVEGGPVAILLRILSFRFRLVVASGRLGGSRGL